MKAAAIILFLALTSAVSGQSYDCSQQLADLVYSLPSPLPICAQWVDIFQVNCQNYSWPNTTLPCAEVDCTEFDVSETNCTTPMSPLSPEDSAASTLMPALAILAVTLPAAVLPW